MMLLAFVIMTGCVTEEEEEPKEAVFDENGNEPDTTNVTEHELAIPSREEWVDQELKMYDAGKEIRLLIYVVDKAYNNHIIVNGEKYYINNYSLTVIPNTTENRIMPLINNRIHLFVDKNTASIIGGEEHCEGDLATGRICFTATKKYDIVYSHVTYSNELFELDFAKDYDVAYVDEDGEVYRIDDDGVWVRW